MESYIRNEEGPFFYSMEQERRTQMERMAERNYDLGVQSNGNDAATKGTGPMGLPTPSLPSNDEGGVPQIPLPPMVGQPGIPDDEIQGSGTANVRVLNGAANYGEVAISIGSKSLSESLPFATATSYIPIEEGFRTVTVSSATYPKYIIYRQMIPFVAGVSMTLALVNSANGIGIQTMIDLPCRGGARNLSCLRMANLSYNSGPLDLMLADGRVVFSEVRFKEVTQYKRAMAGNYSFVVVNSPNRPMPIVSELMLTNERANQNRRIQNGLLEFSIDMRANTLYTIYILGNDGYLPQLQAYVLEN